MKFLLVQEELMEELIYESIIRLRRKMDRL